MFPASRVSVIMPFSKPDVAAVALEKLMRQTYPAHLTEIIVVGQGSSELARRWSVQAIETDPIYYPGEARNIGAYAASGEYFLFLDDDCEPAPDWIEQCVLELQQPKIGAVGGQIRGKSKAFFAQCVDFSSFAFSQVSRRMETPVCSASLGVKRQAFEDAQGFSEQLRSGEDIDFCYRLMKMGYKTVYQPAVKVLHNHRRKKFSVLMRYSYFYGRVKGLSVKLHHREMSKRNLMLVMIQNPLLYFLMILPVSLGITSTIVRLNAREYPRVLLYAPFIFLSKVAYHCGIWQWIMKGAPEVPASFKKQENSEREAVRDHDEGLVVKL
ncbi:MAG TPA: glycosyltransferase [Ktedonobacteraceae bacterium]|nr:glycosyltransferase [Ktedonobacteraceae bacterium]